MFFVIAGAAFYTWLYWFAITINLYPTTGDINPLWNTIWIVALLVYFQFFKLNLDKRTGKIMFKRFLLHLTGVILSTILFYHIGASIGFGINGASDSGWCTIWIAIVIAYYNCYPVKYEDKDSDISK